MLHALRDDVIVRPLFIEHKGLIEIPKSALKYKQYDAEVIGEVISVGPKFALTFAGDELNPGDKLIWQRHEGKRILFEGEKYLVIKSRWIMGKIGD